MSKPVTEPDLVKAAISEVADKLESTRQATEEELAFCRALLGYPLGTSLAGPILGSAIQGYSLRKHVDECHPDQVEKGAEVAPKEGPEREAWLWGYRFVERKERA